ncbi:DUF7857 domain-containing protein [Halobellus limi]|uniref:DUF8080 domain-containing protein n=1 Tax=Halobellus limi TaxID=699433 RepID=A0A1H5WAL8_9EURY|nr:hypothetical protein [Halobellus limi]SEF96430.1 hypothetical protein SAMN04488133_1212 [Halobellus limi]
MQTAFDDANPTAEPPSSADPTSAAADPTAEPVPPADEPLETSVTTTSLSGVTLVQVELRSTVDADLRVRVANDLDGPVLPPRREGVPVAGWDADGFRGVVPGSGRLGVGYACPVSTPDEGSPVGSDPARESPATVDGTDAVSVELLGPVDGTDSPSAPVATAIRSLGRAAPPADAVPDGAGAGSFGTTAGDATDPSIGADALPAAVEEWLDAVESRVQRAERLTDASAAEATAVLVDSGGVDPLAGLPDAVAADESALRTVASRASAIAERAAATDARPVVSSLSAAAERRGLDDGTSPSGDRFADLPSDGDQSADLSSPEDQSADPLSTGADR